MAYDEGLADRIRDALEGVAGVTEKRMFGGLAFLLDGRIAVAARSAGALVRVPPHQADALRNDNVTTAVMGSREMHGWLDLNDEAVASDVELRDWVQRSVAYVRTLPPG